ncbi:MAG: hypothetical protein M1834_004488 [Cirrosporium novae-zelandiae]|nr:MAG: hypothetical protein M1834_004488 [Cirrosporium novae-zelandiae]
MGNQEGRSRALTSDSSRSARKPSNTELQLLLEALDSSFTSPDPLYFSERASSSTEYLSRIRHALIDVFDASLAKDVFRHLGGFQVILNVIRYLSSSYDLSKLSELDRRGFFVLLRAAFTVLSESLREHPGNVRYFAQRVDGGGWAALEQALAGLATAFVSSPQDGYSSDMEEFVGCILGLALGDEMLCERFISLMKGLKEEQWCEGISRGQKLESEEEVAESIRQRLDKALTTNDYLQNAEIIHSSVKLWLLQTQVDQKGLSGQYLTGLCFIASVSRLANLSKYNLVVLHSTGLLSTILPYCFNSSLASIESHLLVELAQKLCSLGTNNLDDAAVLFRNAGSSTEVGTFLLQVLQASRQPPYIQFDLGISGFAAIELSNLGRTFPPTSSAGYTLAVWAYFDEFDENSHTTIFGAFDSTQTCFLLAYLEKDTRNFILQTSVKSSRNPSVRFKSIAFQARRWYHICIVHRHARTTTPSRASLYVDGDFVEELKCHYPLSPPVVRSASESHSLNLYNGRHAPVQAFLGTPQDLAAKIGRGSVTSRWSLGSAHLFEEALSDDLIAVYHQLGPRYQGNFQDCLGSFQTYEASAALNVRNESLHPGKEDHSDIVTAIKSKASGLLLEHRVLLNISPVVVLDNDDRNNIDESQLIKALSKQASKNLQRFTRSGGNAIGINGAVPAINDALTQPHGVALFTRDPVVGVPKSFDDACWRLGGTVAVTLNLVGSAKTRETVFQAVSILFETIKEHWRNSEAIERENGYGVLACLLREKLGAGQLLNALPTEVSGPIEGGKEEIMKLTSQLLHLVLEFVGYDADHPENSIVNNPLAYRILLLDFDLWKNASISAQKLYYSQFKTFSTKSKNHLFNARRLSRMSTPYSTFTEDYTNEHSGVVKKMIDALKGQPISKDVFPSFLDAFKELVNCNISTETLRCLALFVTYALHKTKSTSALRPRKSMKQIRGKVQSPVRSHFSSSESISSHDMSDLVSHKQMGIEILGLYCDILCNEPGVAQLKKFARTVTNKWLLYLLASEEPEVVVYGLKILARLFVIHSTPYLKKFADKSGGFVILQHRLARWWNIPTIWTLCFAILFGVDVAKIDFERSFDLFSLLETFGTEDVKVIYPEVLPVLTILFRKALHAIVKAPDDGGISSQKQPTGSTKTGLLEVQRPRHARKRSMSLNDELKSQKEPRNPTQRLQEEATLLHAISRFLADIHMKSQDFRNFTASSRYVQELLFALFPIVVSSDSLSPELELNSRDRGLSFNGNDVVIRPLARHNTEAAPIVRTTVVQPPPSPVPHKARPLRRGSSFILITSDPSQHSPSPARLRQVMSPTTKRNVTLNVSSTAVQDLLELVIGVLSDQLLSRKDFSGFGLFLKVPPGFQEHRVYFETYLLQNILSHLTNTIQLDQKLLWEPRVLTNLARFATHLGEAVYEGWFLNGPEAVLDFAGSMLEYLQRPDIAKIKSVRLCSQAIATIRTVVFRVVLLRLSELDGSDSSSDSLCFLEKLTYWQTILLSSEDTHPDFLRLICYLLYTKLVSPFESVRLAAANLWRVVLVQKPDETALLLNHAVTADQKRLSAGFKKIVELDNETFIYWIDNQREDLDAFFFGAMSKSWEDFVADENRKTKDTADMRLAKRREKLKQWLQEDLTRDDIIRRHEVSADHWTANIHSSEHMKYQRTLQDHQDNTTFMVSKFSKMIRDLKRPGGLLEESTSPKWRLDQTEGRNRMRLRLVPDYDAHLYDYQPKRKTTNTHSRADIHLDTKVKPTSNLAVTPGGDQSSVPTNGNSPVIAAQGEPENEHQPLLSEHDDGFEIVDDPREDDNFEDKNRKVMRSLQRGDQVEYVNNISRIIGLEACEGLFILGKDHLYLLDNFFQRADGEIVNVWQAPPEERDPYLQMISGRDTGGRNVSIDKEAHETRSWHWDDVISVSKRRFLFRDVALEVFFTDGRSYLLIAASPTMRDDLFTRITSKAPYINGSTKLNYAEQPWRLDLLRTPDEEPQSLGLKFAKVFGQASSNPATRRWVKGDISNFHYLMLINTIAGRTFNDLTQYPVFPWVIADYTSEELDLSNPKSFRDLSKPMGCQTPEREAEFRERYKSFAEMGDEPPFHYGTHYSSAMIVTSYLIRLQPFVQSYLLLQGGHFDHADRLFYSIEKAWKSASRENMTDVRELTPEFFYLPEFLVNMNGYNFGIRQETGEAIDSVELPPWAKGDPKIFVAKNREALESPYVSKNLHHWIDLVFGFKQRGDAALEATNIFHHLSYHGAKDLDSIEDPIERLATIGIIHNFGQTPQQVFQRPHSQREEIRQKYQRLDMAAESLTPLPFPALESRERVSSLEFSWKQERLLCSAAFRLNIPPKFDKYMEWGFADGSVRFYSAENKKLIGLFEHLHIGQLSSALFVDGRTLVTAGTDCTVSVWTISSSKVFDLQPKATLFGHKAPPNILAVSQSFSTLVSVSCDGTIFIWDLNRLEFVRKLVVSGVVECAQINDVNGNIILGIKNRIVLYTLNGELLLEEPACDGNDDAVISCAFYEGAGNEWLERDIILTGHKRGVVNIWNRVIKDGNFKLEPVKYLNHVDQHREDKSNVSSSITCILPLPQVVYTGDEDGRVYEWDCIQRHEGTSGR